jgi:hypothetical protein
VDVVAFERPPSFAAACLAAASGHVLASFLVGLLMVPLALAASSAIVFSGDPSRVGLRLVLPWVVVLAAQPFLAAWIARRGLDLFDAGAVTYARAFGAMALGLVVTTLSSLVVPAEAALPVLGHAWTGVLAAAAVLAKVV